MKSIYFALCTIVLLHLGIVTTRGQSPSPSPPPAVTTPTSTPPPPAVRNPPVGRPVNQISTLAVQVVTDYGDSGTDGHVLFDIGPLTWDLNRPGGHDFYPGADNTYSLPVPDGIALTTNDIVWALLIKQDGHDWKPSKLVIYVNGSEFFRTIIDHPLTSANPAWIRYVHRFSPDTPLMRFLHGLRMSTRLPLIFDPLIGSDEPSEISTPVWAYGVPNVCVTGKVTDFDDHHHYVLLRVENIAASGHLYNVSRDIDAVNPRYLIARYIFDYPGGFANNQYVKICGGVDWDKHPRQGYIIKALPATTSIIR